MMVVDYDKKSTEIIIKPRNIKHQKMLKYMHTYVLKNSKICIEICIKNRLNTQKYALKFV